MLVSGESKLRLITWLIYHRNHHFFNLKGFMLLSMCRHLVLLEIGDVCKTLKYDTGF